MIVCCIVKHQRPVSKETLQQLSVGINETFMSSPEPMTVEVTFAYTTMVHYLICGCRDNCFTVSHQAPMIRSRITAYKRWEKNVWFQLSDSISTFYKICFNYLLFTNYKKVVKGKCVLTGVRRSKAKCTWIYKNINITFVSTCKIR